MGWKLRFWWLFKNIQNIKSYWEKIIVNGKKLYGKCIGNHWCKNSTKDES